MSWLANRSLGHGNSAAPLSSYETNVRMPLCLQDCACCYRPRRKPTNTIYVWCGRGERTKEPLSKMETCPRPRAYSIPSSKNRMHRHLTAQRLWHMDKHGPAEPGWLSHALLGCFLSPFSFSVSLSFHLIKNRQFHRGCKSLRKAEIGAWEMVQRVKYLPYTSENLSLIP